MEQAKLLGAPAVKEPILVSPPPESGAAQRTEAFRSRNSRESIEKVAKTLFAYWDFDEKKASRFPGTWFLNGDKAGITALYQNSQYAEALDAYRDYLLRKIQILWNAPSLGKFASSFYARSANPGQRASYENAVSLLMDGGQIFRAESNEVVRLGEPGLVHWGWQSKGEPSVWDNLAKPQIEYFCGSVFDVLWWKYVDTGEQKYLDRWLAYLDDYLLNQEDMSSLNLDLGKVGEGESLGFLFALLQISNRAKGTGAISSSTVARMMTRQVSIVLPESLFYNRDQSNNHSPGTTTSLLQASEFYYDFKFAKTLVFEGRRQFESYATLESRPDGSAPGRLPEYAMHEYRGDLTILDFIRAGRFDWFTPMLNREYRDRMVAREAYLLHMIAPTGELILTQKNDRRLTDVRDKIWHFNSYYPEVFDDPDNSKIAYRILKNMTRPNWLGAVSIPPQEPVTQMGMGDSKNEEPGYTSYSYPYDPVHVMSSGWDPDHDQFGVFLGSSPPGRGDSFMKENKATNHLNISAFNKDLFCNGVDYAYNYLSSPVLVDGQQQYNGLGEGPTARRGMGDFGLDPICRDRIHYSADFDLAEGTYAGGYATTGDHNPEYYDYKNKLDALGRAIRGVSHHRTVQFIKKHGIWIVTDLMTSKQPREYSQQWWSWLRNKKSPDGFLPDEIAIDPQKRTIQSRVPNEPNYTMYHVGPADLDQPGKAIDLQYDPVGLKPPPNEKVQPRADRHPGVEFIQLKSSWKSAGGRSQLITVIRPHRTADDDLKGFESIRREDGQINGFKASLKDGTEVFYTASLGKAGSLSAGGIDTEAESLLVVHEANGGTKGIVLGCQKIKYKSAKQAGPDFEFASLKTSGFKTQSIYRPIEPVEFLPGIDAFVDRLDVSMKTPTKGTEIRYTVDGSDPTLDSKLYTGPVTFTDTVMVKARAFRKGLRQMPPLTQTGTEMTRVCTAVFNKISYREPLAPPANLKPGLNYSYYEAKWPLLLFGPNPALVPLRKGNVTGLFDLSPRQDSRNKAFAIAYSGYLNAPSDGVYTLYAPQELIRYRPLAGYDLKVELGDSLQGKGGPKANRKENLQEWYPATRRHAFGTWSVALKKGLHPLRVYYADIRPGAILQYNRVEYPGWNIPKLTKIVWDGQTPNLEIAGPELDKQPIPKEWFRRE